MAAQFDIIAYDTETTGLQTKTSQILQIAAVKLSENGSISDTLHLNTKLLSYNIAGPKALETTGLTPDDLNDHKRITEFETAQKTHEFFNQNRENKYRVFMGYNILSFDEELLRGTFFRNLLDPYITSGYKSRKLDLYPALQYLNFIKPGVVKLGSKENGDISYRLSDVALANELNNENAHDALADTMMTVELFNLINKKDNRLFNEILKLSDKKYISKLLEDNSFGGDFVLNFTHFGAPAILPLAPLAGKFKHGQTLCIDVSKNPNQWLEKSAQEIAEMVYTADSAFHMISPTKTPYIFNATNSRLSKRMTKLNYRDNYDLFSERADLIRTPEIINKLQKAFLLLDAKTEEKFSDRKFTSELEMYSKFPTNVEKNLMLEFTSSTSWEYRRDIAYQFKDKRLRELAFRHLAEYAPESIQTEESYSAMKYQFDLRLSQEDLSKDLITFKYAEEELEKIDDENLKISIRAYLDSEFDKFTIISEELDLKIKNAKPSDISHQHEDLTEELEQLKFLGF